LADASVFTPHTQNQQRSKPHEKTNKSISQGAADTPKYLHRLVVFTRQMSLQPWMMALFLALFWAPYHAMAASEPICLSRKRPDDKLNRTGSDVGA
jgi:hypothetical protein